MNVSRRMAGAVNDWLERLDGENERAFGGGEHSCRCMNRPKQMREG